MKNPTPYTMKLVSELIVLELRRKISKFVMTKTRNVFQEANKIVSYDRHAHKGRKYTEQNQTRLRSRRNASIHREIDIVQ